MSTSWTIGVRQPSTISDWRKLIQDFRDQFPYDSLTTLIVETFANSLDAKATRIDIKITGDTYKIIDNGKGMTSHEFREYHNIASLTKHRGEGIGFAGVGAKVYLDRAEYVITETKSKDFHGASHWAFHDNSLEWEYITPPKKIHYPIGTYVEVKLGTNEDAKKLTRQFVIKTLHLWYNAVLMGYYHLQTTTIDDEITKPWQISSRSVEKRKDLEFKYGKHRIRGFLIKSKNVIDEEFQGPFIVVHGKTVMQYWFRQYPLKSETFYGLILADHLIDILRTSKSDFERTSMLWKIFNGKVGHVLSNWLDEIGAKPQLSTAPSDLDEIARELEKSVNKVLRAPELVNIVNAIFQNIMQRTVASRSDEGKLTGIEIEGKQATGGTLGSTGSGEGINVAGDEEGMGLVEDDEGIIPIERIRRKVKGGIKIGFDNKSDPIEGWIDPGKQAIIINIEHPAYKVAEGLTIQAGAQHVRVYHVLRTVFTILAEEVETEDSKKTLTQLFSSWHNYYVKG